MSDDRPWYRYLFDWMADHPFLACAIALAVDAIATDIIHALQGVCP